MNINKVLIKVYGKNDTWSSGKNEPKTNPIKANLQKTQMSVTTFLTKYYENILNLTLFENKANTNPIYRGVASGETGSKAKKCCSPPFCCGMS
ncbi:MAG: hypothetical protein FVQ85_18940 [Planctomycetes bacterium]|nr:hypothetical protein [Planctomycetota bacterium]